MKCLILKLLETIEDDLKSCFSLKSFDPHSNINTFKTWINSLLDEMLTEQRETRVSWNPSKVIEKLGRKIDNEESLSFWAAKNRIPVFCPAFTESGLLAEILYSHSIENPGLVIDILDDLRRINLMAMKAQSSGIIAIGAGIPKHHICKANCIRDGADYAVYVNNAQEFDGSDSGAEPDESVACGKIKTQANPVKIHGDPSLVFPLLVGETFVKNLQMRRNFL